MFRRYIVLVAMLALKSGFDQSKFENCPLAASPNLRFQMRMVSSELQVMKEPGGRTGFVSPSDMVGYISRPQMHAEWKMNE